MKKILGFLSSIPFQIKFAIAPTFAMLTLIGLNYLATGALNTASFDMNYIVNRNLRGSNLLSEANVDVQRFNAHLYRLLTDQAMSPLGKALPERVAAIKAEAVKVGELLTQYRDQYATNAQKPAIETALKQIDDLNGSVDVVASMLEISFTSAASFADPFEAIFDQVAKTTSAIQAAALLDSQNRSTAAVDGAHRLERILLLTTLLVAALIGALSWLIGRVTTRSINGIVHVTNELSHDNLELDIDALDRHDELGSLVHSLKHFARLIGERQGMRRQQEEQKQRAEQERRDTLLRLAADFQANVGSTVQSVGDASTAMNGAAKEMSDIADRNSLQARESSESASSASANVQTVAAAAEQLSASITEISRQVTQAKQTAQHAGNRAHQTTMIVKRLAQAVETIGKVMALINDIAGQTNLLALNATIEAARAGDAGKGFAVVANEVKHLATQTAKATGEIGGQIADVQDATRQAVQAIDEIVTTIADISNVSMVIAAAVEEQQASTNEIVRSVSEVSQQTGVLAENIAGVNEAAVDARRVAGEVFTGANSLAGLCDDLRGHVTDFMVRFREG